MTKPSLQSVFRAAAAALAIAWAGPAVAQTETEPQQAQVTDEYLKSYAAAVVAVQRIHQEWEPRIQAAPDEDTRLGLQGQAQEKMVAAVEAEGLTVEEYNQIFQMAQDDPGLRQQVQTYIEQAR